MHGQRCAVDGQHHADEVSIIRAQSLIGKEDIVIIHRVNSLSVHGKETNARSGLKIYKLGLRVKDLSGIPEWNERQASIVRNIFRADRQQVIKLFKHVGRLLADIYKFLNRIHPDFGGVEGVRDDIPIKSDAEVFRLNSSRESVVPLQHSRHNDIVYVLRQVIGHIKLKIPEHITDRARRGRIWRRAWRQGWLRGGRQRGVRWSRGKRCLRSA